MVSKRVLSKPGWMERGAVDGLLLSRLIKEAILIGKEASAQGETVKREGAGWRQM